MSDQDAHHVAQRLVAYRTVVPRPRADRPCRPRQALVQVDPERLGRLRAGRLRHEVRGHEAVLLDQVERPLPLAAVVEPHHLPGETLAQGVRVERALPLGDSTQVVKRRARLLQEVEEVQIRLGEGFLGGDPAAPQRGRAGEHDGGEQPAVAGLHLILDRAEGQPERVASVVAGEDVPVAGERLEPPPAQSPHVHAVAGEPGGGPLGGAGHPIALERLARPP